MKPNPVKRALKEGKPQVGTWLSLGSVFAARFLARTGLPWLTVDIEHTQTDIQTAALMFGAIADAGCVPLVRVYCGRHDLIKSVLDCGAMGIVVPMVMDADEARMIVRAAKYPPLGNRSVGGSLHALNYGATAEDYFAKADTEILVVIQTEHIDAVERADETYAVEGVDAVFVGPNDLMASMRGPDGTPPSKDELEDALRRIREACARHGVASGLHVYSVEQAQQRIAEGWQFVAVGERAEVHAPGRDEHRQGHAPGACPPGTCQVLSRATSSEAAAMSVLLIGTLDTKGREVEFVRDRLQAHGLATVVVDAGTFGPPLCPADIDRDALFAYVGTSADDLRQRGDRGLAVAKAAEAAARLAAERAGRGEVEGIFAPRRLGGDDHRRVGHAGGADRRPEGDGQHPGERPDAALRRGERPGPLPGRGGPCRPEPPDAVRAGQRRGCPGRDGPGPGRDAHGR